MEDVLVTYASRYGATAGVAEEIGKTLTGKGFSVSVKPMTQVESVSGYKLVIAGSAIQGGSWLPEAISFMDKNKAAFSNTKFATFLVCMTLAMPNGEQYRDHVRSWLEPIRKYGKPVQEGIFAGGLDTGKITSISDKMKFKISVALGVWKEGDHRDWNRIRTWADTLIPYID